MVLGLTVSVGCGGEINSNGKSEPAERLISQFRHLNSEEEDFEYVEFSPDGGRLAFVSDRDGALKLWVMPTEGGEAMALTRGQQFLVSPVWSPDSSQIAYVSEESGSTNVWTVSADGNSDPVSVTSNVGRVRSPRWSPDGSRLLYTTSSEGRGDLWVVPVGGNGASALTDKGN
ncbi:MAG: hypothetical protein CL484_14580, partial [Acidobacteria bacterium]|nr:hypothetical protein [Acidobacteriota bacterium]